MRIVESYIKGTWYDYRNLFEVNTSLAEYFEHTDFENTSEPSEADKTVQVLGLKCKLV